MLDRVSGRPSRARFVARTSLVLALAALALASVAPPVGAATGLTVTTQYPAVVVEPGGSATFALTVDVSAARRVDLSVDGVPSGWNARFRGGGLEIDGVYATPGKPPAVSLDVDVPDGATSGTTTLTVKAASGSLTDTMQVTLRIAQSAGGTVAFQTDYPELRGASDSTFTFNLTLKNDTAGEIAFGLAANGPDGWTVDAKPSGQSQATTTTVPAGSTGSIVVTAKPASDATADSYPIQVTATGGGKTATQDLQVVITGTYDLGLNTQNQVLSATANAGAAKQIDLVVQQRRDRAADERQAHGHAAVELEGRVRPADDRHHRAAGHRERRGDDHPDQRGDRR